VTGPEVFGTNPYVDNRPVTGEVVTVLRGISDRRGLRLEHYRSRAVRRGDVHEIMVTDETDAAPGESVNSVGLIAFVSVTSSGVLLVGASVAVADQPLGTITGFDDTHMPNHQNICLEVEQLTDGVELGLTVGAKVTFGGSMDTR
jgi:hypothetical protein